MCRVARGALGWYPVEDVERSIVLSRESCRVQVGFVKGFDCLSLADNIPTTDTPALGSLLENALDSVTGQAQVPIRNPVGLIDRDLVNQVPLWTRVRRGRSRWRRFSCNQSACGFFETCPFSSSLSRSCWTILPLLLCPPFPAQGWIRRGNHRGLGGAPSGSFSSQTLIQEGRSSVCDMMLRFNGPCRCSLFCPLVRSIVGVVSQALSVGEGIGHVTVSTEAASRARLSSYLSWSEPRWPPVICATFTTGHGWEYRDSDRFCNRALGIGFVGVAMGQGPLGRGFLSICGLDDEASESLVRPAREIRSVGGCGGDFIQDRN
jgi:hypothetical protein